MRRISILAAGAIAAIGASAYAASLNRVAIIDIPGNKLEQFDIGYVDAEAGRYYVTDRSNAAVNIFDSRNFTYVGRVGGFVGLKFNADKKPEIPLSGPNGVAFDPQKKQLWAADGDSTVKVIDVAANPPKIVASISTGGQKRADELGIDTKDGLVLVGNNADQPSYITLISTKPDHAIMAKIEMPDASDGIDQPLYVEETGDVLRLGADLEGRQEARRARGDRSQGPEDGEADPDRRLHAVRPGARPRHQGDRGLRRRLEGPHARRCPPPRP